MQGSVKTSFQGGIHICESHQILGFLYKRQHMQYITFTVTFYYTCLMDSVAVRTPEELFGYQSVCGKYLTLLNFNTHTLVFTNPTVPLKGILIFISSKIYYKLELQKMSGLLNVSTSFSLLDSINLQDLLVTEYSSHPKDPDFQK